MKKVISLVLAISMLAGTTVFAISDKEITAYEIEKSKQYAELLKNATMKNGEDFLSSINKEQILPEYYLKNNTPTQFSNYKKGKFYEEFEDDAISYICPSADGKSIIETEPTGYPSIMVGANADYPYEKYFDNNFLQEQLNSVGVQTITDMRFAFLLEYNPNVILYLNTDKGEFVIPDRDMGKKYLPNKKISAWTIYSADEFAECCTEFLKNREAYYDRLNKKQLEEGYVYVDENGDDVHVTPKPKTTSTPTENDTIQTPKATTTPKATQKPDTTPKPTASPKSTDKPTATTKPINTAIPTPAASIDTSNPPTLSVKGGEHITVAVGDQSVDFPDAQPFIDENGRTQIPLRAFCESLGKQVSWFEGTQTICISSVPEGVTAGGKSVWFTIGENRYRVNGDYYDMDTVAVIKDERTYIPVRFAAEAMGLTVKWQK